MTRSPPSHCAACRASRARPTAARRRPRSTDRAKPMEQVTLSTPRRGGDRVGETRSRSRCAAPRACGGGEVRHADAEAVRRAADEVVAAHALVQAVRHAEEHRVAHGRAVLVVDAGEPVHVDLQEADGRAQAGRRLRAPRRRSGTAPLPSPRPSAGRGCPSPKPSCRPAPMRKSGPHKAMEDVSVQLRPAARYHVFACLAPSRPAPPPGCPGSAGRRASAPRRRRPP